MKLSVIVPVYNERTTILEALRLIRALPVDKQIIVIDDCSTDGTRELLQAVQEDDVEVLFHEENQRKGACVRAGIERARGEWTVVQDADLEYDPQDLLKLLQAAESDDLDVVLGSRFMEGACDRGPWLHAFGRNRIHDLFRILYGGGVTDVSTCYKMVRTKLLQSLTLRCTGFDLDFEIPAKLRKAGYKIHEVPVKYTPRSLSEGKKLRWTDGFAVAWALLRFRFTD